MPLRMSRSVPRGSIVEPSAVLHVFVFWFPLLVVFFSIGFAVEVGHAQATYSLHYPSPRIFASVASASEFSARRAINGWKVFGLDGASRVALLQAAGRREIVVDSGGDIGSAPSMAWTLSGSSLGAWGAKPDSPSEQLKIALFSAGLRRIETVTHSGSIAHPYVVADAKGGFTVLFTWQQPGRSYDIYAAQISRTGRVSRRLVRLAASSEFGVYPRAAWDGSNHLDVFYVEECCSYARFNVLLRRFTANLRPIGRPTLIETVSSTASGTTPAQWGLDVQSGPHGSVWASWADPGAIYLAAWNRNGRRLFERTVPNPSLDLSAPAVSLALVPNGADVYYTVLTGNGSAVVVTYFNKRGGVSSSDRVSFSGFAANPRASVFQGAPQVIWQVDGPHGEVFESSGYHASVPVSVPERMGMGVGTIPLDIAFLAAGALLVAIPVTAINGMIVIPLLLIWYPISRLIPVRYRWPVHAGLVALVLVLVFAIKSFANSWALLMGPIGARLDWIGIAGAIFVGCWISRVGLRNEEGVFRAAGLVLGVFYFLAAMWALAGIEARLTLV